MSPAVVQAAMHRYTSIWRTGAIVVACYWCIAWPATAFAQAQVVQQIIGILSYIEGDYRVAVDESGEVIDAAEYKEQQFLLAQAVGLLPSDADALRATFANLKRAIDSKAPPKEVQTGCRAIKAALMKQYSLTLTAPAASDWKRAVRVYQEQGCAACHGTTGRADGPQTATLKPAPANFHDPEIMQDISPVRAYHAITHGVEGTAMASFARLPEADRWALARYIVAWRHADAAADRGARLLEKHVRAWPAQTPLVYQTDRDLAEKLNPYVNDKRAHKDILAYLRRRVEFRAAGPDFTLLRSQLGAGLSAYARQELAQAKAHFIAAYLDGFEPYESSLTLSAPDKVKQIEGAMLRLQQLAGQPGQQREVDKTVAKVHLLIQGLDRGPSNRSTSFVAAMLIALREGVEAVLLIAVLLGMARRREQPGLRAWIHWGWLSAVAAGLLTWFALAQVLSGMARELAEGIVALAAAVMLLGVTHWMLGQLTAKRWVGFLMRWWEQSAGTVSAKAAIFVLSFIAVYREAFEVVLFFKALILDAAEHQKWVWLGALAGLAILGVVALIVRGLSQRLPMRQFMLASSSLLALLTVVLTGKGVRSLQEAGIVSFTAVSWPEVPALGMYASLETLAAQFAMAAMIALIALLPHFSFDRTPRATKTNHTRKSECIPGE